MPLIKDGNVYRTIDEQVVHLTDEHLKQNVINENVSKDISELQVASNLGGYNLVRFAFERQGVYYKLKDSLIANPIGEGNEVGDYFEIISGNEEDVPAYGYLVENNMIRIDYSGDFMSQYSELRVRNVTKGLEMYDTLEYVEFEGSYLLDYDPNESKKQIFNVLDDLAYNSRTQYASFDLNRDGVYNFVFLGAVHNGQNGKSVFTTDGVTVEQVIQGMTVGDSIQFMADNTTQLVNPSAVTGDVYRFDGNSTWTKVGNNRGPKGETGATGAKGDQGIQGQQGEQGDTGPIGPQGNPGQDGASFNIHAEILSNPSSLPSFSSASVNEAFIVLNVSSGNAIYDLYYKAFDGTDWSILPNWGGVPGPKGDKGDTGPQGIQGVEGGQGPKGNDGASGLTGTIAISSSFNTTNLEIIVPENTLIKVTTMLFGTDETTKIIYIKNNGEANEVSIPPDETIYIYRTSNTFGNFGQYANDQIMNGSTVKIGSGFTFRRYLIETIPLSQ